jgi:hypothetical protein
VSSASGSVVQEYDFLYASFVDEQGLNCASSTKPTEGNQFFRARLWQPRLVGQLLTVLQRVVQSQFHQQRPPMRDPVVTSQRQMLRWEAFSGCCGVYCRVDLDERAFHDLDQSPGTTNVDFGPEMIGQLARLGQRDEASLSVSREGIELVTERGNVLERKVTLPERWIRGFGEVQIYQARLQHLWSLQPMILTKLFQSITKTGYGKQHFEFIGNSLRPTFRPNEDSIAISGIERLKLVAPLLMTADHVNVWRDEEESDVTGWQIVTKAGSLWLVLSPELQRGFSGEGQASELLAACDWRSQFDRVRSWMGQRDNLDPREAATQLGIRTGDATSVFAALATVGLAGFDASSGYYYQRILPFVSGQIERFQPRFRNAHRLLENARIELIGQPANNSQIIEAKVSGDHCDYYVKLHPDGDICTCPWYSRYQGNRGTCKHVLAARLYARQMIAPGQ